MSGGLQLHEDLIDEIAARLDLRAPNQDALLTLAAHVSQHFDVDERPAPLEVVLDAATGVGKTYILTGAMELFAAANEVRDFVIIVPGRTILRKTIDNFTAGHAKSLLAPMSFTPTVVTAENFATPAIRAAMEDPLTVKLYVFTVQALLKPDTKAGRRTHDFQEGLGTELYGHLQGVERLVVLADEHHTYYGPAFSKAVRNLDPWVLVGLTATPDKKTPREQIIYRYPLAAAIADRLVKTPVIVGRKDDRADALTKLTDGVTLLEAKAEAVRAYARRTGAREVNPVMLVVAKDIADAEEYGAILRSHEFFAGNYADRVLVVHSKAPDEALAALETVEDPASPVRIIISVGMLKEGWDVRNVYVIASMRSSVSEILTEQTLGRGMRLPFGRYTDVEILDTLEVVAHERYEDLLKKAGVLNEAFVDYRTHAALRTNASGQTVAVSETVTAQAEVRAGEDNAPAAPGIPVVTSADQRAGHAAAAVAKLKQPVVRRDGVPPVVVPVLRMTAVASAFTLADITDTAPFQRLGASLAADPASELSRTLVSARVVTGADGFKRTELVTSTAADTVRSAPTLFAADELRAQLTEMVLASPAVPARKDQRRAVQPLMDAFFAGLGPNAEQILSANLGRAGARLVKLVTDEQRRHAAAPSYHEVVELKEFNPARATDKPVSADRFGAFSKATAYEGWRRSLFAVEWFDSEPERAVANMADEDDGVQSWIRLHLGELPILWNSGGQEYNPDLIVVGADGVHWVVEVKMEKEMTSAEVVGKRDAARRWANYVSADDAVAPTTWRYLLAAESDVKAAKRSWPALVNLAS